MNWYLLRLPALCFFSALLELDDARIGQWLLSRPIVVGVALGAAVGSARTATLLGALIELATLDDLPMGHHIPLNGAIATAVAVLLGAGRSGLDGAAALPIGLAAGWAFRRVESWARTGRVEAEGKIQESLSRGHRIPFGRIFLRSVLIQLALAAAFLYAVIAFVGPVAKAAWVSSPGFVRAGMTRAFFASPWLGLATVLHLMRPR